MTDSATGRVHSCWNSCRGAEIPYEEKRAVLKKIDDAESSPLNLVTYAQTIPDVDLRSMVVEYASLIA